MSVTVASWATERAVARAHELWAAGERTADIGRAVGVSRDTIVGYARRHHWPPHPHPPRGGSPPGVSKPRKPLEPQQKASLASKPPRPTPKSPPLKVACRPEPLAVPSPPHRSCQWIEIQRPLRMCDAPVSAPGSAWCAAHRVVVYSRPPRWSYGAVPA